MMRVLRRIEASWTTLAICGLTVATGCSKQAQQPSTNVTAGPARQAEPAPTPQAVQPPIVHRHPAATNAYVPAAKPLSTDAQMLDDADATGMTTRPGNSQMDAPDVAGGEGNEASH